MDITAIRRQLDLTQTEFAHALGISPGHVGDLERGRRKLSIRLAAKLEEKTGRKDIVSAVVAEKTSG